MKTETIRSVFENALKNERHDKNSETRFWCGQFKLLAKLAIEQLEQHAIAEADKQEPVAFKKDAVLAASIEFIGTLTGMKPPPIEVAPPEVFQPFKDFTEKVCAIFADTHQQPKREPVATGIEAQVCADIAQRQQLGLAKYGMSVADNPAIFSAWLQHAYEECLDQAVYLKKAIELHDQAL